MKKFVALSAALAVLTTAGVALAADGVVAAAALETIGKIAQAAAFAIGFAAFGTGIAQGLSIFSALSGIARNPETAPVIRLNMIIGLALIESLCIYALVVAFILIGKLPSADQLIGIVG
ncbi:MAG: ATP synthase F0 subunit C [Candidatus Adiutrix sp.]|jgi:F-type H+-transporting ATPase subunit c|nr:ATP synthase F0 subunit C [Candidatus Adiutrix sp.]